jgi:hypothetical protein
MLLNVVNDDNDVTIVNCWQSKWSQRFSHSSFGECLLLNYADGDVCVKSIIDINSPNPNHIKNTIHIP